jgi:putative ABC transport system ATP-binding protein
MDTTTEPDGAPVRVEALGKHYGKGKGLVRALEDVSFTVARGEFLAIIGPSGSGKSTLLHLVAGLAAPSRGRVLIDGQDLAAMNDRRLTLFRRRKIGLVFQAYNLIPALSAEDNVRLPLLLERGARPAERSGTAAASPDGGKIDGLLRTLGLTDRRRHRPDQLSGGEQQRVAIGRAMVNDPSVILADEATGNLDTASSQRLCRLMRDLAAEEGRTILAVTHDPGVAFWARRILVLKDGRIVKELRPASYRTAGELGAHFQELTSDGQEAAPCA